MKDKKKIVGYRRINGRIVPITVRNEAAAVGDLAKKSVSTGAAASIAGLFGVGLGSQYAAGKLQRMSEAATASKKALSSYSVLNRSAKIVKFAGKFGIASLISSQLLKIDKASTKDEKAKMFNIGSVGTPQGLALAIGGAFVGGRVFKRFEKWGLRGGAFPTKLRDI